MRVAAVSMVSTENQQLTRNKLRSASATWTHDMDRDYFDLDAVLVDNQRLACTFKHDVPGLGYLDGGKDRDVRTRFGRRCSPRLWLTRPQIKKGTTIQLPFWLALPLIYAQVS